MDGDNPLTSVRDRLLSDRNALLDLSARNRLLNVPLRTRNVRTIEIVGEKSIDICRLLTEGKSFTFLSGRMPTDEAKAPVVEGDAETGGIPQPGEDEFNEDGLAHRHADLKLQTRLTSDGLHKRLFDIWYDARTLEEEQGVNILYLALGLLRWFEADSSDIARHAPMVLLPVELVRTSAADRFKLKARGEPISTNLSLQAKMKVEFSILIEDFHDEDEVDLTHYFQSLADSVSKQKRWEVLPDAIVLGFFSFAKFLMYRDLDPDTWPPDLAIDQHRIISGLLRDGFPETEALIKSDSEKIDALFHPATLNHVVDADSSQTVAIEETARGRTLVVKGPPGTGKSQTITNVIAAAAAQGKKVLFVAEKMAALEVVHRRLKDVGLGALTLELHSNKANKRTVLAELKRTRELALKQPRGDASVIQKLTDIRDALNAHAERLHVRQEPYGLTPYEIIGHMVRVMSQIGQERVALNKPATWTAAEREEREEILGELTARFDTIGNPTTHPWRGVNRDALDPSELTDLATRLRALLVTLNKLVAANFVIAETFSISGAVEVDALNRPAQIAAAVAALPRCDRRTFAHPAWSSDPISIESLLEAGSKYAAVKGKIENLFSDTAWSADLVECRAVIAAKGRSLFRFLNAKYRSQVALLRSHLKSPMPKTANARLELVDLLLSAQATRKKFEQEEHVGSSFGQLWKRENSDWAELRAILEWRTTNQTDMLPANFFSRLATLPDLLPVVECHRIFDQMLNEFCQMLASTASWLDLNIEKTFGKADVRQVVIADLLARIELWLQTPEQLSRWIAFASRCRVAAHMGLETLVDRILDATIAKDEIRTVFDRSYYEAIRADMFARIPSLKKFDGELHGRMVESFRSLDVLRIALAREQIAFKHLETAPRGNGGLGPLGVLNGELAKRKNHLPIRQLIEKAGPVIQQLKPVFMMSPLSVAQFLKPGAVAFDLLVMDEASQIEPVDALGAIARARQIVVVGDERQLPPTRFFAKLADDIDEKEEDDPTFAARDAESILDLCLAKGIPHRMLNWHYRSRHHSLIAVSNKEFYDNRLFIVPSPYDAIAGMGLKFHHLPSALYDRGGTRTNAIESKTIAEAVIRHARENPEQSLGVAAFSVAQRRAIMNELEMLRRSNPDVEDFFNRGSTEPFFVKNLENIQGDERDVIFISVGYGRDASGYMAMNFGPLSGEGGERRLNVLISRSKLRCEVFSSILGDDIDLERARTRGAAALKLFLTFAQTGKFGLAEPSGRDIDSLFEEQVANQLRALGYDVKTQIGTAGFFVDLAIGDPTKPGRFVLGIECDGAQYHSSRSARDRDRLRQRVLEDHGWIIHRIWSTDWYLRPEEELKKVQLAIDVAKEEWHSRDEGAGVKRNPVPLRFVEQDDEDADVIIANAAAPNDPPISVPYREASFLVDRNLDPHEAPLSLMATYVAKIVEIEGPIHEDEVAARIRTLWGFHRAGSRMRDAVSKGLSIARKNGIVAHGPFYALATNEIRVRDRANTSSPGLRKPDHLPPAEIEVAIISLVDRNFGASNDELVTATSRALGYSATSAHLRAVIEHVITDLLESGRLFEQDNVYRTAPNAPGR